MSETGEITEITREKWARENRSDKYFAGGILLIFGVIIFGVMSQIALFPSEAGESVNWVFATISVVGLLACVYWAISVSAKSLHPYAPILLASVGVGIMVNGMNGASRAIRGQLSEAETWYEAAEPLSVLAGFLLIISAIFVGRHILKRTGQQVFGPGMRYARSQKVEKALKSNLADQVQSKIVRRLIVVVFGVSVVALIWAFIIVTPYIFFETTTANAPSMWFALIIPVLIIINSRCRSLMLYAMRPVIAFSEDLYDERQRALVNAANADARIVLLAFIIFLGLLAWLSVPHYIITVIAIFLGILASAMTLLILTWTLPEEISEDDEEDLL